MTQADAGTTGACPYCEGLFEDEHLLSIHISTRHPYQSTAQPCNKPYSSEPSFEQDRRNSRHGSETTQDEQNEAANTAFKPPERLFTCRVCPAEIFENDDQWFAHLVDNPGHEPLMICKTWHPQEQDTSLRVRCAECDAVITGAPPQDTTVPVHYTCQICQLSFSILDRLKEHVAIHRESLFVCGECGDEFANEVAFLTHYDECTHVPVDFVCRCGERFKDAEGSGSIDRVLVLHDTFALVANSRHKIDNASRCSRDIELNKLMSRIHDK
ncbi:hypothetical protein BZG36_03208 [Bifiguratus adelaidae]|uniref:C2H2-type domain-containing protein n=1 Tax=Bifiguratus adelaidae TaxID=1938954 RepID=A0A261Y161_9FUNG|nr:hypothetical protein BZG36_03208 [Bifiguratus adelaidae]